MASNMYVEHSEGFLAHAFEALKSRFESREALDAYYRSLATDKVRGEFLRTASFYRFLVKDGDWFSYHTEEPSVVDYLTETYKVVALFSLIESASGEAHEDFYDWLRKRDEFPISDSKHLNTLQTEYKSTYGSIRRCIWFFERMPEAKQKALCSAVRIKQKPIESVKELAKFLYQLRSSFVHEARLVLELSDGVLISRVGNNIAACEVTFGDLMSAFEECVVEAFRVRT